MDVDTGLISQVSSQDTFDNDSAIEDVSFTCTDGTASIQTMSQSSQVDSTYDVSSSQGDSISVSHAHNDTKLEKIMNTSSIHSEQELPVYGQSSENDEYAYYKKESFASDNECDAATEQLVSEEHALQIRDDRTMNEAWKSDLAAGDGHMLHDVVSIVTEADSNVMTDASQLISQADSSVLTDPSQLISSADQAHGMEQHDLSQLITPDGTNGGYNILSVEGAAPDVSEHIDHVLDSNPADKMTQLFKSPGGTLYELIAHRHSENAEAQVTVVDKPASTAKPGNITIKKSPTPKGLVSLVPSPVKQSSHHIIRVNPNSLNTDVMNVHAPVSYTSYDGHEPIAAAVDTRPVVTSGRRATYSGDSIIARCLVCGDLSSGVHYGVLACEGCKGFFRRALQDIGDPGRKKCFYAKNCEITVQTRNRCQYCRLQKCLNLGMSRSAAKLGRRSRKMREMIHEATRTIEDSQTAQALHGLLSLKQPEAAGHQTPATSTAVSTASRKANSYAITDGTPLSQALLRAQGEPKIRSYTMSNKDLANQAPRIAPAPRPDVATGASAIQLLLQMQSQADADRKTSAAAGQSSLISSVASTLISLSQAMPPASQSTTSDSGHLASVAPSSSPAAKFSPTASENLMRIIQAQKSASGVANIGTGVGSPAVTSPVRLRNIASKPAMLSPASLPPSGKPQQLILPALSNDTMSKFVLQPNTMVTSTPAAAIAPTPLQVLPVQLVANQATGAAPQPHFIIIGGAGGAQLGKAGVTPQIIALPPGSRSLPIVTSSALAGVTVTQDSSVSEGSSVQKRPVTAEWNAATTTAAQELKHLPPKKKQMLSFEQTSTSSVAAPSSYQPLTVTLPALPNTEQVIPEFPLSGIGTETSDLGSMSHANSLVMSPIKSTDAPQSDCQTVDPMTALSSAPASETDNCHVIGDMVSQGFDSIFRDIKLQVDALRDGACEQPVASSRPKSTRVKREMSGECWQRFKSRFNEIVRDVIRFAKKIPSFSDLDIEDQVNLIKGGCFEVACLVHSAFMNKEGTHVFLSTPEGNCIAKSVLKSSFPNGHEFIDRLFVFASKFNAFELTDQEVAIFSALMLICPDREHVKNLTSVTALQEALLRALRYQIDSNHADNDQLFGRLLMTMTQLRELSTEHKKLLNLIKGLPEKSHDEIFGLIE